MTWSMLCETGRRLEVPATVSRKRIVSAVARSTALQRDASKVLIQNGCVLVMVCIAQICASRAQTFYRRSTQIWLNRFLDVACAGVDVSKGHCLQMAGGLMFRVVTMVYRPIDLPLPSATMYTRVPEDLDHIKAIERLAMRSFAFRNRTTLHEPKTATCCNPHP